MTVLLTLTTVGADNGSFDIYTNINNFQAPFFVNISVASLLAGFSIVVDDLTTDIKVISKGNCTNSIFLSLV